MTESGPVVIDSKSTDNSDEEPVVVIYSGPECSPLLCKDFYTDNDGKTP